MLARTGQEGVMSYTDDYFDQQRDAAVQMQAEFERTLRVLCAWCDGVLQDGGAGTSHGICRVCKEKLEASV